MKNKYVVIFSTALLAVLVDQVSKFLISSNLSLNKSVPIINKVFHLTYIQNTGAGFGILKDQTFLLVLVSIMVIGFILYYITTIGNDRKLQILVGIVLGGTVGNLIDRLAYGSVIDFLDFRIWPIFNFADSFVTIGVIGLIIYFWKKK
jgi:signal peptidase II|tara:strand:+ start:451 stop:894 length:444 start_codon:yes stop_codon:yes gene_type:complete